MSCLWRTRTGAWAQLGSDILSRSQDLEDDAAVSRSDLLRARRRALRTLLQDGVHKKLREVVVHIFGPGISCEAFDVIFFLRTLFQRDDLTCSEHYIVGIKNEEFYLTYSEEGLLELAEYVCSTAGCRHKQCYSIANTMCGGLLDKLAAKINAIGGLYHIDHSRTEHAAHYTAQNAKILALRAEALVETKRDIRQWWHDRA